MPVSRLLLIVAAFIATISIGVTTMRPTPAAPVPDGTATPPQDIAAMIPQIEAKLKANPTDAEGWRMLGVSLFETQRFAESAAAYQRAADLKPDSAESWSNLGEALVSASRGKFTPAAKQAFSNARERDPKDVRARYFLAVEKDIAGDHKGAIAGWVALLKESPPNAPWQADVRGLIASVAAEHNIDVRAQMAAVPLSAAPNATGPAQQSAMIQSMVDGLAIRLAEDPKDVDGWIMLMRSHLALGQPAKATAARKAALAANPASAANIKAAATQLGVN